MSVVSDQRMELALRFLAESDEGAADARSNMERAEAKAKAVRETMFKHFEGTVAERNAEAGASKEYAEAMSEYFDALREHEYLRNKRQTESIVIDVWRSLESSRRASK